MLRLRRLKINKFRTVKPGTELVFHEGCNVVLGRNATGKTTLLELISMALRFDFSSVRDEDFDVEVEIDERLEGTSNSVVMQVGTRVDDSPSAMFMPGQQQLIPWVKADIRVGSDTYRSEEDGSNMRLFKNGTLLDTGSSSREGAKHLLWWALFKMTLTVRGNLEKPLPIWGSVIRGSRGAIRHDESLDSFKDDILGKLVLITAVPKPTGKNLFASAWVLTESQLLFAPTSLLELARRRFEDTPDAAMLTFSSDALPFLGEFIQLCGFASASLDFSLRGTSGGIATFGEPRFLFTRKGSGDQFRHELLSYGQKRLLSLLYFLESSPGHLVADEMVNGLHHEWIEVLMEKIRGRQTFLSSQNPLLLDYLEFESADEVSRSFVLCELDESEHMVWRNMSAEEASSFHSAYEVGIQHVSEILRTKGLW